MNVMQNDEVNVLSGNGLGGTSLINANVTIRPDRDCFEQTCWPSAVRMRSSIANGSFNELVSIAAIAIRVVTSE